MKDLAIVGLVRHRVDGVEFMWAGLRRENLKMTYIYPTPWQF